MKEINSKSNYAQGTGEYVDPDIVLQGNEGHYNETHMDRYAFADEILKAKRSPSKS